jgi:uroporphyrinogen III methyltransferase/synthase
VTYPEAGDVLVLVRGHENESDAPDVDWSRLAPLTGTLVCYAGAQQIATATRALIEHGRNEDEAAALIYNATLASQRTIDATLGTIADKADPSNAGLLVVGAVVGLRAHLRWYDERALSGRRIVVTRSREQAGELIDMLEERGAEAIGAPSIRIVPPEDPAELDAACAQASTFDWIVFTSANAVDQFMSRLLAIGDVRDRPPLRACSDTVSAST